MAFISITRLRLRSIWYLPIFFRYAIPTNIQASKADGNLKLSSLNDAKLTFWTCTAWRDASAMKAFMLSGAHRKAMPKLLNWCDEAAVAHYETDDAELPTWPEAHRILIEKGRPSKVNHPSPGHEKLQIAPPKG
jgi:hypothetical protein